MGEVPKKFKDVQKEYFMSYPRLSVKSKGIGQMHGLLPKYDLHPKASTKEV